MKTDQILLNHGSGAKMAHQLTEDLLLPMFDNPMLAPLHDGAVFELSPGRLAFSTDTFVRDPNGKRACIIGEVTTANSGRVVMQTRIKGERIVDMLAGEQLPRIC